MKLCAQTSCFDRRHKQRLTEGPHRARAGAHASPAAPDSASPRLAPAGLPVPLPRDGSCLQSTEKQKSLGSGGKKISY